MVSETKLRVAVLVLVLVGTTTGCLSYGGSSASERTPSDESIAMAFGINIEDSPNSTAPFNLAGQVYLLLPADMTKQTEFEDVQLCLYNRNGTLLESTSLGRFEVYETIVNFSVQTDQRPWYIYAHHPELSGDVENDAFRSYNPELDRYSDITSLPSDLPFEPDRLNETRCRPA